MISATIPLKQVELNLSNSLPAHLRSSKQEIERRLLLRLREKIDDQRSLLRASIWLGVTPASLRKILAGRPLSNYLFRKLSQGIQNWNNPSETLFLSPKVQRLLSIYRLYQEKGTLAAVGKRVGLTRERVRQLLENGALLGLFEYKKPSKLALLSIPKEKIIDDYRNLLQFNLVAQRNGISLHQFHQLVKYYQITRLEFEMTRHQGHQIRAILQYFNFVSRSGRHLSTTELQKTAEGRYLSFKLTKLWGSIHVFRKELKIPSPVQKFKPI